MKTITVNDCKILDLRKISDPRGNLTPIGASANIAGIGILRKDGFTVRNSDFLKIGFFMNIIILAANIFIVSVVYPFTPLK